ncbi:MAG: hypothetical protein HOP33_14730 [Verrucomicrobia bacterium]|nr:hypothetical protein [Verrucomicrobiota bacterium]
MDTIAKLFLHAAPPAKSVSTILSFAAAAASFVLVCSGVTSVRAEYIHSITIDGNFADWATVPSHFDPVGGPGVFHNGIPDTHDTDHSAPNDIPVYVNHPDIDLVEYKFTHDSSNLYAYFRATGVIGRTITNATQHGRYYVIVTLDVDSNTNTGYGLHEGGYYPTSYGYDMNMEVEYYDGHYNKGNYLNHGATNQTQLNAAFLDQMNGIVRVLPGSYDFYPEWVWFDTPNGGTNQLPAPDNYASIRFVKDRGPSYQGIVRIALSPDGHQAEMVAPFRGFMRDATQPHTSAKPIISLGKTLKLSFSLEASPELSPQPNSDWASDTGDPIANYYLSPYTDPQLQIAPSVSGGSVLVSWSSGATGMKLQRTPSLTSPDWQVIAGSDSTNHVTWPIGSGNAFFRLAEP